MEKKIKMPTDRSFGVTFAVVFALVGGWQLWNSSRFWIPAVIFSAAFAIVSFTVPRILHPLNVVWMRFGMLLNKIVSPIVMGLIFFVVFTPVALLFRLIGRDALRRRFERDLTTYWLDRDPPGPDGDSLPRQF